MARRRRKKKKQIKQLQIAVAVLIISVALLVAGIIIAISLWLKGDRRLFPPIELPPKASVASNLYDEEAFYRQDGFLHYDAPHMVGIDVSAFQGHIDWERVAQSGVEFAIIRVGYRGSTQGLLYEDETFAENLKGARKAGLKVGAYFFSQARNGQEAMEEAEFAAKILKGETLDLPLFYDWELVEGTDRFPDLSLVPMTECAMSFCERAEQAGFAAGVYFNQSFGYRYLDMSRLQEYTLWLAEYNPLPTFDYHFHLVQYSDKGKIPGIETTVDLNLWILE